VHNNTMGGKKGNHLQGEGEGGNKPATFPQRKEKEFSKRGAQISDLEKYPKVNLLAKMGKRTQPGGPRV